MLLVLYPKRLWPGLDQPYEQPYERPYEQVGVQWEWGWWVVCVVDMGS